MTTQFPNLPQLVVKVQNGDGVMEARWTPSESASLCDNKWHKIVVSKLDSMVSLKVDSNPPSVAEKGKRTVANVKDNFYLGGVPGSSVISRVFPGFVLCTFFPCRDLFEFLAQYAQGYACVDLKFKRKI